MRSKMLLEKINNNLNRLNDKFDELLRITKHSSGIPELVTRQVLDGLALLELPDHLRKTAIAILKMGRSTAEDIREVTHRARAVESAYLNQLVRLGYLEKERYGRKAYFFIKDNGGDKFVE